MEIGHDLAASNRWTTAVQVSVRLQPAHALRVCGQVGGRGFSARRSLIPLRLSRSERRPRLPADCRRRSARSLRAQRCSAAHLAAHDYPVQPVPFTAVHLNDVFWAPRIETNRQVSIPFAFEQCELSGRMDNFVRAAAALRGEALSNRKPPGYPFDDTDPYKVIEGASYALSVHPDPKLEAYVDGLIAKIGAAQEPDGYLYTTRSIDPEEPASVGRHRALDAREGRQPRALQPRDISTRRRSRTIRRPASARCSTSRSRPRICSRARSVPASARSGPATRSPRWGW